jgi:hypothetical protein
VLGFIAPDSDAQDVFVRYAEMRGAKGLSSHRCNPPVVRAAASGTSEVGHAAPGTSYWIAQSSDDERRCRKSENQTVGRLHDVLFRILESYPMTIHDEELTAFVKFGPRDIPPHPDISRRMLRRLAEVDESEVPVLKTAAARAAPASSVVLPSVAELYVRLLKPTDRSGLS